MSKHGLISLGLILALIAGLIAAGSSALFGFGVRAPSLSAIRLIFHFLGYGIGSIAIARVLRRRHPQLGLRQHA